MKRGPFIGKISVKYPKNTAKQISDTFVMELNLFA